jgi:hypothetical protein
MCGVTMPNRVISSKMTDEPKPDLTLARLALACGVFCYRYYPSRFLGKWLATDALNSLAGCGPSINILPAPSIRVGYDSWSFASGASGGR